MERADTGLHHDPLIGLEGPVLHVEQVGRNDDGEQVGAIISHDTQDSTDEEEEWLILVRILRFQRPATHRAVFVSSHDDVALFLTRIWILATPVDGFYELLIPEVQAVPQCITLLLAPKWWRQVDAHVFQVVDRVGSGRLFTEVAWPTSDLEQLLPLHMQENDEMVQLFNDFMEEEAALEEWPQPLVASTTILSVRSAGVPRFLMYLMLSTHRDCPMVCWDWSTSTASSGCRRGLSPRKWQVGCA